MVVAFSPGDLMMVSAGSVVAIVAAGVAFTVVEPYWALVLVGVQTMADPVGFLDGLLVVPLEWLDTFMRDNCRVFYRKLRDAGVPFRVVCRHLFAPLFVAALVSAYVLGILVDVAPRRVADDRIALRNAMRLTYACVALVGASCTRQKLWEQPSVLGDKPVTLGLQLVPCILWQYVLSLGAGFYGVTDQPTCYLLFAAAGLGYHAYLATRPPDVDSLRGLTTSYGAARVLGAFFAFWYAVSLASAAGLI